MTWNWRTGLLAQARSDYRLFRHLHNLPNPTEQCHRLRYLQMATEKLAKGLMSDSKMPPALSHKAFATFVKQAHKVASVCRECGFDSDEKGFMRYLQDVIPIAEAIEDLVPKGVAAPNAEYPWEERRLDESKSIRVTVKVPADHSWPEWDARLPGVAKLMEFLEGCFRAVEREMSQEAD